MHSTSVLQLLCSKQNKSFFETVLARLLACLLTENNHDKNKKKAEETMPSAGVSVQAALSIIPGIVYGYLFGTESPLFPEDGNTRAVFKCSSIVLLMLTVLANKASVKMTSKTTWLVLAALFFSMLGDAALVFDELFVLGLAFFLVGHIMYAALFSAKFKLRVLPVLASLALTVVASAIIVPSLLEKEPDLVVPVVLYTLVISSMLATAGCGTQHHVALATTGAWLFASSDFMIAINKFVLPFQYAELFIHVLYFVAQALLTLSVFTPRPQKGKRQ